MTGSDFRNVAACAAARLQAARSFRTVADSEFDVVVSLYQLAHTLYAREIAANGCTVL
jgi:hypothetical protein